MPDVRDRHSPAGAGGAIDILLPAMPAVIANLALGGQAASLV